jgi:hypothetical protein
MSQLPQKPWIQPEEHAQHAAQVHLGDVLPLQGADELVQVFVRKLHEELLELIASGEALADIRAPAILIFFEPFSANIS